MLLEKTLKSPLDWRRSHKSILKEINPDYSLEGLIMKLKLQYLTWWKRPWCWTRLKAGGKGDDRGWDGWMASLTQWIWVWASSRRWWRTGWPGVLQSTGLQRVWHDWGTEQQQNQTKMSTKKKIHIKDYNFKNDGFLSSWFQGKKMSVRSVLHMHFWSLFF